MMTSRAARTTAPATEGSTRRGRNQGIPCLKILLALGIHWLQSARVQAEDHVDFRYELYKEDNSRMEINTYSVLFEKSLLPKLSLKGEMVYDGISGSTPTGGPPPPGSDQVPLAHMADIRKAGSLEVDWTVGRHTLSPQLSYSEERDYRSTGLALNDAIEFNQKNTTLHLGVAHNFDQVYPKFFPQALNKDATDFLIGLSQLLSPQTVLSTDFTLGFDGGYLADPYRGVQFAGYPLYDALFPEQRPEHRTREVARVSMTQFLKPVDASVEASYRLYHDTYGIWAHTVGLNWNQKLGRQVILAPFVRYYVQSAASFYNVSFAGDPTLSLDGIPTYYSADYRLSHFYSVAYGLQASVIIKDRVYLDAGYQRYEMHGLDGMTSASAYPQANIFTLGVRVWF